MAHLIQPKGRSFADFEALLKGRAEKKLGHNTTLRRVSAAQLAVKYHDTDVVTITKQGEKTVLHFFTGGWKTVTTKERLNDYAPKGWWIVQEKGEWYWSPRGTWDKSKRHVFTDGDSFLDGAPNFLAQPDDEANRKALRKKIRDYADAFAKALPVDRPSGRDCWYCHMVTTEGKTLGDSGAGQDHLHAHLEENYFVPSLLYHALKEAKTGAYLFGACFKNEDGTAEVNCPFLATARTVAKRALVKYMYRRFGTPNMVSPSCKVSVS